MNRSPQTLERRRNSIDAATGISRVRVALYACLAEGTTVGPRHVLEGLRRYAEARDWTVAPGASTYDIGPLHTPRHARRNWPVLKTLIRDQRVSGLVIPDESHVVVGFDDGDEWRAWTSRNGLFVVCLPDVLGSVGP